MAAGVPVVTTRVGQAPALVDHGRNGHLVDVDDAVAVAGAALRIRGGGALAEVLTVGGYRTAEQYAYERLDPKWADYWTVVRHATA